MAVTRLRHILHAIGLDEAGRGPLAGPVVAAAVYLPPDFDIEGLNDSKKLTALQREELEARIKRAPHAIASVEVATIDSINILQASLTAMTRALEDLESRLPSRKRKILLDGNQIPAGLKERARAVVCGDGIYACIAAASILAKTERDRLMRSYAEQYPHYGFERNFGYGTPEHLRALEEFGPCPLHRRSFEPVARKLLQPELAYA